MAKVIIVSSLAKEIEKKFKGKNHKIIALLESLEESPRKAKLIGQIEGLVIKEIKYNLFRFYFITEEFKLKVLSLEDLQDLLIKFVRMSDKRDKQRVIEEIKLILKKLEEGFSK